MATNEFGPTTTGIANDAGSLMRVLDEATRLAIERQISIALDFTDWEEDRMMGDLAAVGVSEAEFGAALRGEAVREAVHAALVKLAAAGLPAAPIPDRLLVDPDQIALFTDATFRYANPGARVSLRAFAEGAAGKSKVVSVTINTADDLIKPSIKLAQDAADAAEPWVFCPPIASFRPAPDREPWRAAEADLDEAYALSVELDNAPAEGLERLQAAIGPATAIVSSGGVWIDPANQTPIDKLHAHWRLKEPATGDQLAKLKRARMLATGVAGGDPSNIPSVHPIRWPGSWHRKAQPRMARILALNADLEAELDDILEALETVVSTEGAAGRVGYSSFADALPPAAADKMSAFFTQISSGASFHDAHVRLSAQLSGMGCSGGAIVTILRGLMLTIPATDRDRRWHERYEDIGRTVDTAEAKFGSGAGGPEGDGVNPQADLAEARVDVAPAFQELPEKLLAAPGLVGQITSYIVATARSPQPGLAMLTALALVGTAAGRIYATPTRSGTHLYALGLAPTGAGKNHPMKMGKFLMEEAGLGAHIRSSQFMSYSSVFTKLGKESKHLAFIDEFGGYLARIASTKGSPHERAVKDILRSLWGASFETVQPNAFADGREMPAIRWPSLSIVGASTPEEFYAAVEGQDVFNGFLNRFFLVHTKICPAEVEPQIDEWAKPPSEILDALAAIARPPGAVISALQEGDKPPKLVPWATPSAHATYGKMKKDMELAGEDGALLSRLAEMACRLATIRAIGINWGNPLVTDADMEWGRDLAMWSAQHLISDAREHMAVSEHQRRTKLVIRHLKSQGSAWVTRTNLVRKVKHEFDARSLNGVLTGLAESGELLVQEQPAGPQGGRPVTRYRYVG